MNWLRELFSGKKRESEIEEEVRSHLKMAALQRAERGEDTREAERAARREFGRALTGPRPGRTVELLPPRGETHWKRR